MAMDAAELDVVVAQAQLADDAAFARLLDGTQRDLRCFIAAHAFNQEQIEEIFQSTWVTAYENLARYELRGNFLGWLKGIARNLLRRDLADRARRVSADTDMLDRLLVDDGLASLEEEHDLHAERLAHFQHCLDRLTPRARSLIERRHGQQIPMARLAQQFKQTSGAIAMLLWRIRQNLRTCLDETP